MAIELDASFAVHPGKWVRAELIEPHGLTISAAAQSLDLSRQAMSNFLNGRSNITAEIAADSDEVAPRFRDDYAP